MAVTAASGRLGRAVLRELRALGAAEIVAVAREPAKVGAPGVTVRSGDYASVESMRAALGGVDTAVVISAPVKEGTDRRALHANVIAAAHAAGVRRILYTSVVGHDTAADTLFAPFHAVNRATEQELRESGLAWTVLRNGLYLELDVGHIVAAGPDGVYANPGGAGRAPYITIDEIAFATAKAALDDSLAGRTLNVTGECLPQAELVRIANETFGLAVRYETMSDEACIAKFRGLMPERGAGVARMLTGCFQCIRTGAFDVPSDYAAVAGRPAQPVREMMEDVRRSRACI